MITAHCRKEHCMFSAEVINIATEFASLKYVLDLDGVTDIFRVNTHSSFN